MASFLLERPKGAACRIWLIRAGKPPILLAPLASHRRLWGDLYDWGKGEAGCHLTAATLAVHCGLRPQVAAWIAPRLVEDVLAHEHRRTVRIEFEDIAPLLLDLVEEITPQIVVATVGRKWAGGHA